MQCQTLLIYVNLNWKPWKSIENACNVLHWQAQITPKRKILAPVCPGANHNFAAVKTNNILFKIISSAFLLNFRKKYVCIKSNRRRVSYLALLWIYFSPWESQRTTSQNLPRLRLLYFCFKTIASTFIVSLRRVMWYAWTLFYYKCKNRLLKLWKHISLLFLSKN